MSIGPVENHRRREEGVIVYPVYSRRSGGLSVGINLFPNSKVCSFDCPYCEVFPFETDKSFSLALMEEGLIKALNEAKEQGIPVRDLCFSGNGESTLSPYLFDAIGLAFRIRDKYAPEAELVLISNGTGLLNREIFDFLTQAAGGESGLRIWLKLDAGSPEWYKAMNRSAIPYESLMDRIKAFAKGAPVILQTMICIVNGEAPSPVEAKAWEALVKEIVLSAPSLRALQIYGKARPAPEDPLALALPAEFLEARADSIRSVLASMGKEIPVGVFP